MSGAANPKLGFLDAPVYSIREQAAKNLKKQQAAMVRKQARKVKARVFAVNDLVGVRVPELDRPKTLIHAFPGIIVDVRKDGYKVRCERLRLTAAAADLGRRTEKGVLKGLVRTDRLLVFHEGTPEYERLLRLRGQDWTKANKISLTSLYVTRTHQHGAVLLS